MADVLYVGLQDDDKIVTFGIDAGAGKLVLRAETPAAGAPSVFAVSPDRRVLYVGYRSTPGIESCRIDSVSGALTSLGRVLTEHPPTYFAADRTGKYLLSAYYQGAYAAVHPLGSDGAVGGPALDRQNTAPGAHAILTDPSNRFAFVPHIARQNDNVLEPPARTSSHSSGSTRPPGGSTPTRRSRSSRANLSGLGTIAFTRRSMSLISLMSRDAA
jgi:6-phosphogluconolactonase (cycloisomerase 2 family)